MKRANMRRANRPDDDDDEEKGEGGGHPFPAPRPLWRKAAPRNRSCVLAAIVADLVAARVVALHLG
eukprot:5416105-Pyramimonas_sp.AAC.1